MDVVIRNLIRATGDDANGGRGEGGPVQTDSDGMIDFATLLETNEDWAAINPLPSTGKENTRIMVYMGQALRDDIKILCHQMGHLISIF